MTRKEWQAIQRAGELLGLGERASQAEIKQAYHRLCKRYHPDTASAPAAKDQEQIYALTEAYELLTRYCRQYRFPLKPRESDIYDPEDWWLDRFGQDPLWSRKK